MFAHHELLEQILALAPEDRAFLADQIEQSLATTSPVDATIAEEWSREIDRRIAAYDRGETQAEDIDVALDRMSQSLAERRARSVKP